MTAMFRRREVIAGLTGMAASLALPARAVAQAQQPLRIVVGFAPGGGVDVVARLIGNELSGDLQRTIDRLEAAWAICAAQVDSIIRCQDGERDAKAR